ncbi:MAG TPA: 16S rRNA (cytosine(1402)-N(4))-methyltransferase RsmH [Candidatus Paceibacterota bacterium]|nr:16S rRNA (cytosine(1402)-N(4))-methyltransferase RsmH [Candidatus Paceibacterota bacterium]
MRHETVLLHESVEALAICTGDTVVDATLGGAGHFALMRDILGQEGTLVGIDADSSALTRARERVPAATGITVHLVHGNFRDLERLLDAEGIEGIDGALFDLGWSGFQLEDGRGFSFRADEPLLMTYGEGMETNAADFVNNLSETALADLLYTLGEERFSRGIAKAIVARREESAIETTAQLVEAVEAGVPAWYRHRKLHPATKTFQALRIAVNDELGAVREGVAGALNRLSEGGRVAVITFHSIEDRIVKAMFRDAAHAGQGTVVTKKPVTPSASELAANPRARSAKLRVFERGARPSVSITQSVASTLYA